LGIKSVPGLDTHGLFQYLVSWCVGVQPHHVTEQCESPLLYDIVDTRSHVPAIVKYRKYLRESELFARCQCTN